MQEFYPIGQHHCYACVQWDGKRSYDQDQRKIKVDASSPGQCRISHTIIKGTAYCDNFFPLR
jgi:hypothetical protein